MAKNSGHTRLKHTELGPFETLNARVLGIARALNHALGVSLYLKHNDGGFAVANAVSARNRALVADRVDQRLLAPSDSCAVEHLSGGTPGTAPSRMAEDHVCHHITERSGKALIQIVKPADNPALSHSEKNKTGRAVRTLLADGRTLSDICGAGLAERLNLKPAYKPRDVVLCGDISGYGSFAARYGQKAAAELTKQFYEAVLEPLCLTFNARSFRPPQGDDFWLGFDDLSGPPPGGPASDPSEPASDIIVNRTIPMAKAVADGFEYLKTTFGDDSLSLRQAFAAGEVEHRLIGRSLKREAVTEGEIFFRLRAMLEKPGRADHSVLTDKETGKLLTATDKILAAEGPYFRVTP